MEFVRRLTLPNAPLPHRVGILAGSFNPPTVAHLHLLEAARPRVDELLCVLPRRFPHKAYHGASLDERIALLSHSGLGVDFSIGVADGGLLADIAAECRAAYEVPVRLFFLCGRDAAERIVEWDYGRPGVIEEMLERFELLVAPRGGHYQAPGHLSHRIHRLPISDRFDSVSSTELRDRIAGGLPWEELTPEPLRDAVKRIYS
jgi:nicotinic acid mononucleotide adenylyltransferase